MKQRIISGLIILIYLTLGFIAGGVYSALRMGMFCLLPFFAIWFPTAMGDFVGSRLDAPSITEESPGCLVQFLGWILLFVPVIATLVLGLSE